MTLADYSLSDYAFDRLDVLIDQLKKLAFSCNETEIFVAMIPQFEEFANVARSKEHGLDYCVCACLRACVAAPTLRKKGAIVLDT